MKWRTDKPTADVIVAKLKDYKIPHVLTSFLRGYYQDEGLNEIEPKEIEKWADLEEDETVTDCDELEEEINRLWEDGLSDELSGPHNIFDVCKRLARHFAKWGAKHLKN